MHRLALAVVLGCTHPAPATPKAEPPEEFVAIAPVAVSCDYAYNELPMYVAPSHQQEAPIVHAHADARAHHANATRAIADHHPAIAAAEFLACAGAYAAITDDDSERGLAQKTAELCIGDATYAYATAGQFAEVGKAALAKLAADDPRLAAAIDARLAKPPSDCN